MMDKKGRESFAASLDRHVEAEGKILDEYRALAEKMADGPVGLLVDLILTEEEQHHFLLRTMAKHLRQSPAGEAKGFEAKGLMRDELLRQTRRLREHERETISACGNLKSQVSSEEKELFDTLLDVMILDSEKHERLLAAIERMVMA
ncbi:MAG: hypothetical protein HYY83_01685 [Deltaproteobacteria bacterium]|nr:hypothetical protein [Deltaproteobacteria bacterium]